MKFSTSSTFFSFPMKYWMPTIAFFGIVLLASFSSKKDDSVKIKEWYQQHLDSLNIHFTDLTNQIAHKDTTHLKATLEACRMEFKVVEIVVAYNYPLTEQRLNGPDVYEVEPSDFSEVDFPSGFQVLEDVIYDKPQYKWAELKKQCNLIQNLLNILINNSNSIDLNNSTFLDMIRFAMYNIASKGISGFDTPASSNGLAESAYVIRSIQQILMELNLTDARLNSNFENAANYVDKDSQHFNDFDRAYFLSEPFRHCMNALFNMQKQHSIPFAKRRAAVKSNVESIFDQNAFDPYYFSEDSSQTYNANLVTLGKKLFYEKGISMEQRSCASCHQPDKAFTDGLVKNNSLQKDIPIQRNTPTLWNVSLQPILFYDGRQSRLEDQAHDVIQNKDEMDGNVEKFILSIQKNKNYQELFKRAFKDNKTISTKKITVALSAYERSLINLNSRFDQYLRGKTNAISDEEKAGFNLFMGKAQCGTCHYNPLFNGSLPPFYNLADLEIIGVPKEKSAIHEYEIDPDKGGYNYTHNTVQEYAFKTPSLRSISQTAPYMHNGVFTTLEEVIDFYNKGGGAGLGIKLKNQTLSKEPLNLNPKEQKELIAFLKTI